MRQRAIKATTIARTTWLQGGFTLIELMVTVAIVAILAAIAIPNYRDYVLRGKVPDATSTLANQRVAMEQFFQDHTTYVGAGLCAATTASPGGNFSMSCSNLTATTYTLNAAGVGAMQGFTYSIDEHNNKSSIIASPAPNSWMSATQPCWVTKAGGQC